MSQAIETLMHEHRLIVRVMGSLETFARRVEEEGLEDRARLGQYVEFARTFADHCHHRKEEDGLFRAMMDHGLPRESGPLAVMYADHDVGRRLVSALAAVASGSGPFTPEERSTVVTNARELAAHLVYHISKEDRVLYPMAERIVPPGDLERLSLDFERIEQQEIGAGEHERLHALAEALLAAFPPARETAGCACQG